MKNVAFIVGLSRQGGILAETRGEFVGLPCLENLPSINDITELSRLFHDHINMIAILTDDRSEDAMIVNRSSGIWNNEPANFVFLTFRRTTVWRAFNGAVIVDLTRPNGYNLDFTMDVARLAVPSIRYVGRPAMLTPVAV